MSRFDKLATFSANGIAMDTVANAVLFTVPSGQTFFPVAVIVKIVTPPSDLDLFALTVGTVGPNYTNIAGERFNLLRLRDAVNRLAQMEISDSMRSIPQNTEVRYRVAAASIGGGVVDVEIVGFLR